MWLLDPRPNESRIGPSTIPAKWCTFQNIEKKIHWLGFISLIVAKGKTIARRCCETEWCCVNRVTFITMEANTKSYLWKIWLEDYVILFALLFAQRWAVCFELLSLAQFIPLFLIHITKKDDDEKTLRCMIMNFKTAVSLWNQLTSATN